MGHDCEILIASVANMELGWGDTLTEELLRSAGSIRCQMMPIDGDLFDDDYLPVHLGPGLAFAGAAPAPNISRSVASGPIVAPSVSGSLTGHATSDDDAVEPTVKKKRRRAKLGDPYSHGSAPPLRFRVQADTLASTMPTELDDVKGETSLGRLVGAPPATVHTSSFGRTLRSSVAKLESAESIQPQGDATPCASCGAAIDAARERVEAHRAQVMWSIAKFEEGVKKGTAKHSAVGLSAVIHPRPPKVSVHSSDEAVLVAVSGRHPTSDDMTRGRSHHDVPVLGRVRHDT